jgi:hypothetical protein
VTLRASQHKLTPLDAAMGGTASSRKKVGIFGFSEKQKFERSSRGGLNQDEKFKDLGRHTRWHVNAGQAPKKYCQFCPPELNKNFRRVSGTE